MRIDLHIHTRPKSPCSAIDPSALLEAARQSGLEGICLTEHQNRWADGEVREWAKSSGTRIFQGNEITTSQGDILVFGLDRDVKGVVPIQDLRQEVEPAEDYPQNAPKMWAAGLVRSGFAHPADC